MHWWTQKKMFGILFFWVTFRENVWQTEIKKSWEMVVYDQTRNLLFRGPLYGKPKSSESCNQYFYKVKQDHLMILVANGIRSKDADDGAWLALYVQVYELKL